MLKAHRESIRSNFALLVSEIPFHEILAILYQDRIFNESIVNELLAESNSKRNFSLLLILQYRGGRAFTSFLNALKKANRSDLARALTDFEDCFAKLSL